jgi:hypothetical protein
MSWDTAHGLDDRASLLGHQPTQSHILCAGRGRGRFLCAVKRLKCESDHLHPSRTVPSGWVFPFVLPLKRQRAVWCLCRHPRRRKTKASGSAAESSDLCLGHAATTSDYVTVNWQQIDITATYYLVQKLLTDKFTHSFTGQIKLWSRTNQPKG